MGVHSTNLEWARVNGQEINDKQRIAEMCNNHFVSIRQKLAGKLPVSLNLPNERAKKKVKATFKFRNITLINVYDSKLINGKATGVHHLPNKLLKISKEKISSSLAGIFNQCIKRSTFPYDFKMGQVAPFSKMVTNMI